MVKSILALSILSVSLAVAYYFVVALPAHNKAILDFEKQKYQDQKAALAKVEEDKAERETQLARCISQARSQFDLSVRNNGVPSSKDSYTIDSRVANNLQHTRDLEIAECHRRYDSR